MPSNVTFSANFANPGSASSTLNVTWTEQSTSGTCPVGYFVIEYSTDPTFSTYAQTTPIEQPDSPDINQTPCQATSNNCFNYSYQLSGLAPSTTYYGFIWAYSQDGTNLVQSSPSSTSYIQTSSSSPTNTGVTTAPGPPSTATCGIASVFSFFYPPANVTPSGLYPVQSYKLYENQNSSNPENLILGASTYINPANPTGCAQKMTNAYLGVAPYSNSGVSSSSSFHFPVSLITGNVYGFKVSAGTTAIPTGYYQMVLFDASNNILPSAQSPADTFVLICPYAPPSNRSQASNKC